MSLPDSNPTHTHTHALHLKTPPSIPVVLFLFISVPLVSPHLLISCDVITQRLNRIQHTEDQLHMSEHSDTHISFLSILFFIFTSFWSPPQRKGCRSSLGCETTESSSGGEKLPWMNSVLQVCPDRVSLCLFLSITFTQGTKDLFSFIYTLHKCFTNQSEVLKVKHILIRLCTF